MAQPVTAYAQNINSTVAFCQIIAPGLSFARPLPAVFTSPVFDLLSYEIVGGSSSVGTIIALQGLSALSASGSLVWNSLPIATVFPLTLANSTNYTGVVNGPYLGVQFLMTTAVGNGVIYGRLTGLVRDK